MKNAVILPYYKAFQQDLGQIYPKNQIFTMARTRKMGAVREDASGADKIEILKLKIENGNRK